MTGNRVGKWPALALISILVLACDQSIGTQPSTEPSILASRSSDVLRFAGAGQRASDPFELAAGDYRLDWQATASGHGCPFSVDLTPIGHKELILGVLDIVPGSETRTGSKIWAVDGGRYSWSVTSLDCTWSIELRPVS